MRTAYFVGLDLGQRNDPTALAVLEWREWTGPRDAVTFEFRRETALCLRHVERMPLGTPYPEVVARVAGRLRSRQLGEAERRHLIVDGTGVGPPVVDLLSAARLPATLWPVIITAGDAQRYAEGYYRVPKRDLIVGLQVTIQSGGLQIAEGMQDCAALVKEMAEMKVRVTGSGNERYGADGSGEHDDLVSAVSLACWGAKRAAPAPRRPQCPFVF